MKPFFKSFLLLYWFYDSAWNLPLACVKLGRKAPSLYYIYTVFSLRWLGWLKYTPPSLYTTSTQTLQMSCSSVETELNFSQSADGLKRGIRIVSHTVLLLLDRSENSCKALTDKIQSRTGSVILLKNLEDTYVPNYIGKSIFKSFKHVVHHLVWP